MTPAPALSAEELRHFRDKGYLALRGCFTKEAAAPWIAAAFKTLGCDPDDPKTWKEERAALPATENVRVSEFAPRAWAAVAELAGGEKRVEGGADKHSWSNSFLVKFPCGDAAEAKRPLSHPERDWHKDGDEDHVLDGRNGLVAWVLWSEVKPGGGATIIVPDSIGPVARFLSEHPEGVPRSRFNAGPLVAQCREFVELTGEAGDVFLAHPYMLHSDSRNVAGAPRFLTVRNIALDGPLNFNRRKKEDFSPVESAVLAALGRERFPFKRTA